MENNYMTIKGPAVTVRVYKALPVFLFAHGQQHV